jgi:hypothetical protein
MFGRRILVLVAVLMGLTALAASLAPPPQSVRRAQRPPASTPEAAPALAAPTGSPGTVTATLSADPGPVRTIRAARGDTVQLDVSGDVVDTVVIPALGVAEPLSPGSPAQLELYADAPGRYAISLLESGRTVGALRISAAS